MARYKKYPSVNDSVPGLFDDLDPSAIIPGTGPLPVHPSIERAAAREQERIHGQRRLPAEMSAGDERAPPPISAT